MQVKRQTDTLIALLCPPTKDKVKSIIVNTGNILNAYDIAIN